MSTPLPSVLIGRGSIRFVGMRSPEIWAVGRNHQHSRKRKRVDFSPSENSDEQVKNSHDDSEIPFADIIQGVSDSLNLPSTSTAIKPSKKPSACLGSDGENTENKALPLSPRLAAIWKDLDNDLKGSKPSGMPMGKENFLRDILRAKRWLLKTILFR